MKITKINIKDYNQFKNLKLDLTYPKGHEKEGQALEKICFLGQSGTGKTSLLNVCKAILRTSFKQNDDGIWEANINEADQKYHFKNIKITSYFKNIETVTEINEKQEVSLKTENLVPTDFINDFYADKNRLIYFPAEIVDNINRILIEKNQPTNSYEYLTTTAEIKQNLSISKETRKIFDFETENFLEIWTDILKNINDYKVEELKYSQQIATAFTISTKQGEIALSKFKRWKQDNPNPIEKLAQKLNPILQKFYLTIKTAFDFQSIEDLKFIKIQSVDGTEIPYHGWS
jgi:energy-coupling factor transporter ATP-binding protein EcfA2